MTLDMDKSSHETDLAANIAVVRKRLKKACLEAARPIEDITLTAVSKTQPTEKIEQALALGLSVFGENKVQEAASKWPSLKQNHKNIELRLIGPLQTNKAKQALALFDVIETLDREKLAAVLAKEIAKGAPSIPLLVQVNTGEEPQKAGIAPREAIDFVKLCQQHYGLNVVGFMCIPPANEPPSPHFALLAKLARQAGLRDISMGMSGDYDIAAQLGATHVRIGTAIFGQRV
jgi:PLP dependent protein